MLASPNAQRDDQGVLPAMRALYDGDAARARELLPADEELTAAEAAAFGRMERLSALLDANPASVNELSADGFTPLHLSIFGGQADALRLLLDRGADVEVVSQHSFIRVPPLGTAAFVRDAAALRALLERGADPNAAGEGGFRALHTAAQNGDRELVRLLLDHGADPAVPTDDGREAADLAREAGHEELARELSAA